MSPIAGKPRDAGPRRRSLRPRWQNDGVPAVDPDLFAAAPEVVAPRLLGLVVHHDGVGVRISEVEAYAGERDPGSHGFRGRTPRNAALFGPPGTVYVYISYGVHRAFNLVCGPDGESGGVLVRAGEVVEGEAIARRRRGGDRREVALRLLARGPGNLGQALGVDLDLNGTPVTGTGAQVRLTVPNGYNRLEYRSGPRVGVSGPGGDGTLYPWRFWMPDDPTVSAYRPAVARRRAATNQHQPK